MSNYFNELYQINVNENVEKKQGLSYLSWAWAWAETKKKHPTASYEIKKFGENQLPYVFDATTGYMVYTTVTIEGITHEMWLPVMDNSNKAMKNVAYKYKTKAGEKTVESATMFDINKTLMRCLVKNLAMHGLGLYIYAGEDLPEKKEPELNNKHYAVLNIAIQERRLSKEEAKSLTFDMFAKSSATELTLEEFKLLMKEIEKFPKAEKEEVGA